MNLLHNFNTQIKYAYKYSGIKDWVGHYGWEMIYSTNIITTSSNVHSIE